MKIKKSQKNKRQVKNSKTNENYRKWIILKNRRNQKNRKLGKNPRKKVKNYKIIKKTETDKIKLWKNINFVEK